MPVTGFVPPFGRQVYELGSAKKRKKESKYSSALTYYMTWFKLVEVKKKNGLGISKLSHALHKHLMHTDSAKETSFKLCKA